MKRIAVAGIVATLIFAGQLTAAHSQTPVSTEQMTFRVGIVDLAPSWSSSIVLRANLWKPYLPNITIDRSSVMTGMAIVNSMLAGRLEAGYYGDMPSIVLGSKSQLNQTRLVAISEGDDGHETGIYVKAGSPFTSVKQLDGKTISVPFGGFTHRFVETVEATENVKFKFVGQSPEVGLNNVQTGKVEAYAPWHPFGPLAVAKGYATLLVDGTKYHYSSLRPVVVSKELIDKHPDVAVGWMRAELDAHKLMQERPDECAKMIAEDWAKYSVPVEVIRPDFDYKVFPNDISPKWRKVLVDGAAFLLEHKFIDQAPDWNSYIDDSLLKKANAIPSQMKIE
jgi:NitT/TauT family transport system substrate-binding protein